MIPGMLVFSSIESSAVTSWSASSADSSEFNSPSTPTGFTTFASEYDLPCLFNEYTFVQQMKGSFLKQLVAVAEGMLWQQLHHIRNDDLSDYVLKIWMTKLMRENVH